MILGFFHDVKVVELDGKMYSSDFGYYVWKRYLKHVDKVIVCTRKDSEKHIENYSLSSGEGVEFRLNEYYKSPIQYFVEKSKIQNHIAKVVLDIDVCVVRLPSIMGMLAIEECKKKNKPYLVEVVGCTWDALWNYGNIKGKLLAPIMYYLTRKYIKNASFVSYVTLEFLQSRYPTKGKSIGVSDVSIELMSKEVINSRITKIEERNNNPYVLGLIGSLNVGYKGHAVAIKAIKSLVNKGYNVKLKCLGGGDKGRWMKLANQLGVTSHIEFSGTLPSGQAVYQWLDDIDLFVMPSKQEGLPRSMVEAMSRGCNVIGSNIGGIPELLDKECTFSPHDLKLFETLIIKFLTDKELSIAYANKNFNVAKRYEKIYLDKKREELLSDFINNYCKYNK